MKLSKHLGRVATTFLATAMLASLTAVPAFAAEFVPDNDKGQYDDAFKIVKHLKLAENTFAPAQTFTFKIEKDTANEAEKAKGIEDGVDGAIQGTATATTTANDTATDENNAVKASTDEISVKLGEGGITHAGSYKYKITEVGGAAVEAPGDTIYDEVTYDTSTLTMYVHVKNVTKTGENPLGLEVDFVELFDATKSSEADKGKTDGFNNEYGTNLTDDKLYNVTLTKLIDGDGANMDQTFGFQVTINSKYDNSKWLVIDENGDGKYNHDEVQVGDEKKADTWIELKDGVTSAEFELGHEQTAQIIGLTKDDTYTIVESDAGFGYTTTATQTGTEGNAANEQLEVTGTIENADEAVTYTNLKKAITPTGIVMNVAPYALLVVVAAAGCFVFLRKRRED